MNEYVNQNRDKLDRKVYCQCPAKHNPREDLAIAVGVFLIPMVNLLLREKWMQHEANRFDSIWLLVYLCLTPMLLIFCSFNSPCSDDLLPGQPSNSQVSQLQRKRGNSPCECEHFQSVQQWFPMENEQSEEPRKSPASWSMWQLYFPLPINVILSFMSF